MLLTKMSLVIFFLSYRNLEERSWLRRSSASWGGAEYVIV